MKRGEREMKGWDLVPERDAQVLLRLPDLGLHRSLDRSLFRFWGL